MPDTNSIRALDDSSKTASPARRAWLWRAAALLQVRARLVVVLVAIGLIVGYWEVIAGQWNWVLRQVNLMPARHSAVSSDTEFFCPMDPGVLSPWEDECPICHMALVRRKKGEAVVLPDGVVARMQVSPERLQLAGVKTARVDFRPLEYEIVALGLVRDSNDADQPKTIAVRVARDDIPFIAVGQVAEVRLSNPEAAPARGKLAVIDDVDAAAGSVRAEIALDPTGPTWPPGALATAIFRTRLAEIEPYRSLSREPPPLRKGELRVAYVSREHPEVLHDRPGRCPLDGSELNATPLTNNQRLDYWCPMHPEVFSPEDGHECAKCNGMKLLPRIISYARPGQVLSVPHSAVIDTGRQRLVYVEVAPGMLEAWPVKLGSRAGGFYPVLAGLTVGNRVVAAGAMLLDAETRLSGQASTAYFGAGAAAAKPVP